jgi:hypothetical protein
MLLQLTKIVVCIVLTTLALASLSPRAIREETAREIQHEPSISEQDGVNRILFDHAETGATLDFVKNSGICETTPGVNQYSGYLTVGSELFPFTAPQDTSDFDISEYEHVVLVLRSSKRANHRPFSALAEWRTWMFVNDWSVPGIYAYFLSCLATILTVW